MKTKKLIEFGGLVKHITDYAKENCNGNFTMAVRQLIQKALKD